MATQARLQIPKNVPGTGTRLQVVLDSGTIIEIPIIQSEAIVEAITGTVTGNVAGDVTGDVTGDLTGTVTTANAAGPHTVDWVDSSTTPGDCTCNSISGKVAIALGDNEVVVTNTKVAAGDLVFLQKLNNDATLTDVKCITTANTITITGDAVSTAAVYFHFLVVKVNDVTPA